MVSKIDGVQLDTTSSNFTLSDLTSNGFYRTNTWTPYYSSVDATTSFESDVFTTASYITQFGEYTRIGDMVFATANIVMDHSAAGYQNGGADSQAISLNGLPFKAKNTTNYYPMTSTIYFDFDPFKRPHASSFHIGSKTNS